MKIQPKNASMKWSLMEDFNARVERSRVGEENVWFYGVENRNERGEYLVDFTLCSHLKILNTFGFGKKWM